MLNPDSDLQTWDVNLVGLTFFQRLKYIHGNLYFLPIKNMMTFGSLYVFLEAGKNFLALKKENMNRSDQIWKTQKLKQNDIKCIILSTFQVWILGKYVFIE